MAIFNNSGSGVLLNYDVIFKEAPYTENELLQMNSANHIIQIDTNLNNVPILDEKKALPSPTLVKTYDKATKTAKNFGRIAAYDHGKTYGFQYDANTATNVVFYLKIAKNVVKESLSAINLTIPALTSAIKVTNIDDSWTVLCSNDIPAQNVLAYEIKTVTLTNPKESSNIITVSAEELMNCSSVNFTKDSYLILSSKTTFSGVDKIAVKATGGLTSNALTEVTKIRAETNSIFYLTANYQTKYIPLSSQHIYRCTNYEKCSVPRFLYYTDQVPAEGLIGNLLEWEDENNRVWKAPGKKGEIVYLAYSYKDTVEPIIEDYTLEYYLPKLYSNKQSDWELISDWFKTVHTDKQGAPLKIYYNNMPKNPDLSLQHVKEHYSVNKKVYQLENDEYILLTSLPKIYIKESEFDTIKNDNTKVILQEINGIDTLVTNLNTWSETYYYYNPIQIYYNTIMINDWFNENCINTWEFSSTEPYYNIYQNQQAYSIKNLNKKTYWFQIGDNYQDQEFNAIKSEINPINTAITTISCYFDISKIIEVIGGYQILDDPSIELIQLYFNGYIYKKENNVYIRKDISRNVEKVTSISTLIEGKLTTITDKNTETIGPYAFYNYKALTYADFPNCENIEYGGGSTYATAPFQGCTNLNVLKLPKWNYPYYTNTSKSYCVSGTAAASNKSPFRVLKNLTEINYGVLSLPNAYFNKNGIMTNTNFIFYDSLVNNKLTKITISSCSQIGNSNFYNTNLQEVVLGNSDNISITIGNFAFGKCVNLNNINLNRVTSIGSSAFINCASLNNIINLSNIQTIGSQAFAGCAALTTLNPMTSTAITINQQAFLNCTLLEDIDAIGCGLFGSENKAFIWNYNTASKPSYFNPLEGCTNLKTLKLGVNENIPSNFFNDSTRKISTLTTVAFPNVPSIAAEAFKNLNSLENVLINVDIIENSTFENCNIKQINENESEGLYDLNIAHIKEKAFAANQGQGVLENINLVKEWDDLNNGVIIDRNAFKNAPLKKINISQLHPNMANKLTANGYDLEESPGQGAFTINNGDPAWSSYQLEYLRLNNVDFDFASLNTNNSKDSLQYFEANKISTIGGFSGYTNLSTLNCSNATTINENGLKDLSDSSNKININITTDNDRINYDEYKIFNIPNIDKINADAFKNTKINVAFFPKLASIGNAAFENTGINKIYCGIIEDQKFKYSYINEDSIKLENNNIDLGIAGEIDDNDNQLVEINRNTLCLCTNDQNNNPIAMTIGREAFKEDSRTNLELYLSPHLTISGKAFSNRQINALYFISDLDDEKESQLSIQKDAFFNCGFEIINSEGMGEQKLQLCLPIGENNHFKIEEGAFYFENNNIPEIIVIANTLNLEDNTQNNYLSPKAFLKYTDPIEFYIKIDNATTEVKQSIKAQCEKYEHIHIIEE